MRDGDWLVGWGCATAAYPTQITAAAVRVRLSPDGSVLMQIAAQEIGNGIYTVLGQTAAERLGVPLDLVRLEVDDSALPAGPVAGGSNTTASTTSVLVKACDAIRTKLFQAAATMNGEGSDRPIADYALADGHVYVGDAAAPLAAVFQQMGQAVLEEYAESVPRSLPPESIERLYSGKVAMTGGPKGDKLAFAFGAQFVEVRVHARTREIRVPRALGAFAAGKIVNPRTARSQLMGGIIWGLSSALHEATELDERAGRYVNTNLADYLIPVNADIQTIDVILVPETDDWVNPLGVKGLGELGNVGVNAAVANAVYHATGVRVRISQSGWKNCSRLEQGHFDAARARDSGRNSGLRLRHDRTARLFRGSPMRSLAFGLVLRGFPTTLLRLRMAQVLLVLFGRLLVGGAGFAESDRHRLLAVFHLLSARPGAKLAMLELVHDAFDGFLLRLGFARRHFSSPFDTPQFH